MVEIPPGVDLERFRPLAADERSRRAPDLGLPTDGPLVVSVSRLVPRKGMDVLIEGRSGSGADDPDLTVAIAGRGTRLDRAGRSGRRVPASRSACSGACPMPTCRV